MTIFSALFTLQNKSFHTCTLNMNTDTDMSVKGSYQPILSTKHCIGRAPLSIIISAEEDYFHPHLYIF